MTREVRYHLRETRGGIMTVVGVRLAQSLGYALFYACII